MAELTFTVRAPSNVALIKYMGKKDSVTNLPENPSLSMTLHSLCSVAEVLISSRSTHEVKWVPETPRSRKIDLSEFSEFSVPNLNVSEQQRISKHTEFVLRALPKILIHHGLKPREDVFTGGGVILRTANTFPLASGIASSASSFAAVTLATAWAFSNDQEAFQEKWLSEVSFREDLSKISRQGSGSSCRSLDGPWVSWEGESARKIETQMPEISHLVMLASREAKDIGSSEAHRRVKTSPAWQGRIERVQVRHEELRKALSSGSFQRTSELAWQETWEMHGLFHTAQPPFTYWKENTHRILDWLSPWMGSTDAPIVTMDAGPNVHLLVKKSDRSDWEKRISKFDSSISVLKDVQGTGAALVDSF